MTKQLTPIRGVYITLIGAVGAGGIAWGTLQAQVSNGAEAERKNEVQIEELTKQLNILQTGQAVINSRTQRIETDQRGIRDDIKLLLRRIPAPPSNRRDQ